MFILTTAKINPRHLQPVKDKYPFLQIEYGKIDEVQEKLKYAEIMITYGEDLTEDIIAQCKKLKWLMVVSAGLDKLPFQELGKHNILVTNAKGIHKVPMAEHAFMLMLQDSRRFTVMLDNQRKNIWDRTIRVDELAGKNLLIVGAGAIGEEIARKGKAFDMTVYGINRSGKTVPYFDNIYKSEELLEVLPIADYVIVVTPLTEETKDLFGEKEFKAMSPKGFFINLSRGEVVKEQALLKALKEKWIRGAALDTFREEPLPENSPLWQTPNLILTPHLGGRSPKYMERAMEIFKHNLDVYLSGKGKMINRVDLTKGY